MTSRKPRQGEVDTKGGATPAPPLVAAVGDLVEIPAPGNSDRVTLQRPDGTTVTLRVRDGRALYVLDQNGHHTVGDVVIDAQSDTLPGSPERMA